MVPLFTTVLEALSMASEKAGWRWLSGTGRISSIGRGPTHPGHLRERPGWGHAQLHWNHRRFSWIQNLQASTKLSSLLQQKLLFQTKMELIILSVLLLCLSIRLPYKQLMRARQPSLDPRPHWRWRPCELWRRLASNRASYRVLMRMCGMMQRLFHAEPVITGLGSNKVSHQEKRSRRIISKWVLVILSL